MRLTRIYQAVTLRAGECIQLDAQAAAHVVRVLRLQVNDPLVVFNGEGGEFHGYIETAGKRTTQVRLEQHVNNERESHLRISLGQCISRGDRMDFAVQKAVELGVDCIYPLHSRRSGAQIPTDRREKRRLHWQRVVVSACEQSGRNRVPAVHPVMDYDKWLQQPDTQINFVLDPDAGISVRQMDLHGATQIGLVIGPEGGLSADELTLAREAGFISLRLGPRILRTETAAAAALSAIQALWGDLA